MTESIQAELITINMLCPHSCYSAKRRDESQPPLSSFGNGTLRLCHGLSAEHVQTYTGTGIASCNFSLLGEPTGVVQLCFPPCGCIFSRSVVMRPWRPLTPNPKPGVWGTSGLQGARPSPFGARGAVRAAVTGPSRASVF